MNVDSPKLIRALTRVEVPLAGTMTVGRSPDCNLVITEGQLSRRHAQLSVQGNEVSVEDLGSTNGTFVNGRRIAARTLLKPGDKVRFDVEEFEFLAPVVEEQKTVMRSAPSADAGGEAKRPPGAWVTGEGQGGDNKTLFMGKDEIKNLLGKPAVQPAQARKVDTPTLLVTASNRELALRNDGAAQQEWSIGSDATREIPLTESGVSALHAKLVRDGQRWKLLDQMSANGTFVNGKKTSVAYLESGDRLRFGPVEVVLLLPGAGAASSGGPIPRPPVPGAAPSARRMSPLLIAAIAFAATVVVLLAVYFGMR